jgi:hypothetical protein
LAKKKKIGGSGPGGKSATMFDGLPLDEQKKKYIEI